MLLVLNNVEPVKYTCISSSYHTKAAQQDKIINSKASNSINGNREHWALTT